MKINSYEVGMDSARTYSSTSTRKLSFAVKKQSFEGALGDMNNAFSNSQDNLINSNDETMQDTETTSGSEYNAAKNAFDAMRVTSIPDAIAGTPREIAHTIDEFRQQLIKYLWQILFGKEHADKIFGSHDITNSDPNTEQTPTDYPSISTITIYGLEQVHYEESETMNFSSVGNISTEDGRNINFSLGVQMSRSFSAYYSSTMQTALSMCDPLVINYAGDVADLTDEKIFFDLDQDGEKESISNLADGNGFLALDNNRNGIIDDGSELFGAKSGDGFADLAKYDADGNGWIDENDAVFEDLKIMVQSSDGSQSLYSLKEKNVGAIYLGNADADFTLKSGQTGQTNGAIRKMGFFLYEDGTGAGLMSHLDIAN